MKKYNISVIGLGYIALCLDIEFAKQQRVLGFEMIFDTQACLDRDLIDARL